MNLLVLAFCLFAILCPHHHAVHRRIHAYRAGDASVTCAEVTLAYQTREHDIGNPSRDEFVKTYPPRQQHSVLACLGDE